MKRNNIVNKIMSLVVILLIAITMTGSTYALSECDVNLKAEKNTLKKDEEFTVDINISDIKSEMGISALGATLEYDKDSLYIEKIEGKNDWETPTNGMSYNAENGKIAVTKSGFAKKNETIFSITFKVREESKKNLSIMFTDITASDGMELITIGERYTDITVKNGKENPKVEHGNSASTKKGGINIWVILLIIALIIVVILFFNNVKSKKHRKK